jgi:proline dehydrogenase
MLKLMRKFFLFLSRQKHLRRWMETSRFARRWSARFVAGDNLPEALETCQRINAEGISVTLDHLGENVTSLEEAEASRDAYQKALGEIGRLGIDGNVSLKLTQFGMDLSLEKCRGNVEALVAQAAQMGNFVRVDMESSEYTDRTLELVVDLHARYKTTGVVIQAYLSQPQGCGDVVRARDTRAFVQGRVPGAAHGGVQGERPTWTAITWN